MTLIHDQKKKNKNWNYIHAKSSPWLAQLDLSKPSRPSIVLLFMYHTRSKSIISDTCTPKPRRQWLCKYYTLAVMARENNLHNHTRWFNPSPRVESLLVLAPHARQKTDQKQKMNTTTTKWYGPIKVKWRKTGFSHLASV